MNSPRDGVMNCPRYRHGQAVVTRAAWDGSPFISVSVANGTQQSASFMFSKCIS